ncbi:MAG: hypothetical protein NTV52_32100 [Acidobacteria bacterium]|nr:hypothetical protein [Acidobacteriota bacterium]
MRLGFALLLLPLLLSAQTTKRLTISGDRQVRPHQDIVLQVKVYSDQGRLREAGWTVRVVSPHGGWLSKPFRFQGTDSEPFAEPATNLAGSIFRQLSGQFTIKDALVYHAPETPGKYSLEFRLGETRSEVEITVDPAPPLLPPPPEKWTFGPDAPTPHIAQETWFDWRADTLRRTDFDNDWEGANNWDNLNLGSSQAYVYYAAIESQSHWFLIYNFFHARDYSDNCIVGTCHENDNEGVILAIRKDGSEFGKLETMEALAHNNVYSYTADPAIRAGAHNIEAPIVLQGGSHPVVFLEAGGHGALGGADSKSFFDSNRLDWRQNTGITYTYKGIAERPRHGVDREVGYDLLPIYHHWWARARQEAQEGERTFSAFYNYVPFGNRPRMRHPNVAGSFFGVKHSRDKAKPFWGWHDVATQRKKILATGQWAVDPAYSTAQNLRFPPDRPMSADYVFNPYLAGPDEEPPFVPISRNLGTATVANGSCTIEVIVDGTVAWQPSGYQVLAGAPHRELSQTCTAPLPPDAKLRYRLEKNSGRGEVIFVNPDAGRVEVRDTARGAATYRFTVHWAVEN